MNSSLPLILGLFDRKENQKATLKLGHTFLFLLINWNKKKRQ